MKKMLIFLLALSVSQSLLKADALDKALEKSVTETKKHQIARISLITSWLMSKAADYKTRLLLEEVRGLTGPQIESLGTIGFIALEQGKLAEQISKDFSLAEKAIQEISDSLKYIKANIPLDTVRAMVKENLEILNGYYTRAIAKLKELSANTPVMVPSL